MDKENSNVFVFDSEKILKSVVDPVHSRIEDMKKYEEISRENEKLRYFLFGAYISAAQWHHYNKKFDLKQKIAGMGENYIGLIFGLEDMKEGKFPDDTTELRELYDFIYNEEFISDLKKNAREIHDILTGDTNRPRMYV